MSAINPLLATILPALKQIEREKQRVIQTEECEGALRKKRWRERPENRAVENAAKRKRHAINKRMKP